MQGKRPGDGLVAVWLQYQNTTRSGAECPNLIRNLTQKPWLRPPNDNSRLPGLLFGS